MSSTFFLNSANQPRLPAFLALCLSTSTKHVDRWKRRGPSVAWGVAREPQGQAPGSYQTGDGTDTSGDRARGLKDPPRMVQLLAAAARSHPPRRGAASARGLPVAASTSTLAPLVKRSAKHREWLREATGRTPACFAKGLSHPVLPTASLRRHIGTLAASAACHDRASSLSVHRGPRRAQAVRHTTSHAIPGTESKRAFVGCKRKSGSIQALV